MIGRRDRDDVSLAAGDALRLTIVDWLALWAAIVIAALGLVAAAGVAYGRAPDGLDPLPVWGVEICRGAGGERACRFATPTDLDRATCLPIALAERARAENRRALVRCLVDDRTLRRIAPTAPNILPVSGIPSRDRR